MALGISSSRAQGMASGFISWLFCCSVKLSPHSGKMVTGNSGCLSSTPAEERMPIYLLLWQKFRISFDYTDLCPMLFPDLITVPRGVENTAWLGLELEWDWPHPNDLG